MRAKDIELEQLVGILSSIEVRNKYPGWYPVAQMLRRMFGVKVILSFYFEMGEAKLNRMGVRGFIKFLKVYGYERKAELEKSEWVDENRANTQVCPNKFPNFTNGTTQTGSPQRNEFTSLGDILGRRYV
jgi:hypothetical protein